MPEESWYYCSWCNINYAISTSDAEIRNRYCCMQCEVYGRPKPVTNLLPPERPEAAFLRGQQVMLDLIVTTTIATGVAKAHIKAAPITPYTPPTR